MIMLETLKVISAAVIGGAFGGLIGYVSLYKAWRLDKEDFFDKARKEQEVKTPEVKTGFSPEEWVQDKARCTRCGSDRIYSTCDRDGVTRLMFCDECKTEFRLSPGGQFFETVNKYGG